MSELGPDTHLLNTARRFLSDLRIVESVDFDVDPNYVGYHLKDRTFKLLKLTRFLKGGRGEIYKVNDSSTLGMVPHLLKRGVLVRGKTGKLEREKLDEAGVIEEFSSFVDNTLCNIWPVMVIPVRESSEMVAVMPQAEGDLFDLVGGGKTVFALKDICRMVKRLEYALDNCVKQRLYVDLKLENILYVSSNDERVRVFLGDIGSLHEVELGNQMKRVTCTYYPPEFAKMLRLDMVYHPSNVGLLTANDRALYKRMRAYQMALIFYGLVTTNIRRLSNLSARSFSNNLHEEGWSREELRRMYKDLMTIGIQPTNQGYDDWASRHLSVQDECLRQAQALLPDHTQIPKMVLEDKHLPVHMHGGGYKDALDVRTYMPAPPPRKAFCFQYLQQEAPVDYISQFERTMDDVTGIVCGEDCTTGAVELRDGGSLRRSLSWSGAFPWAGAHEEHPSYVITLEEATNVFKFILTPLSQEAATFLSNAAGRTDGDFPRFRVYGTNLVSPYCPVQLGQLLEYCRHSARPPIPCEVVRAITVRFEESVLEMGRATGQWFAPESLDTIPICSDGQGGIRWVLPVLFPERDRLTQVRSSALHTPPEYRSWTGHVRPEHVARFVSYKTSLLAGFLLLHPSRKWPLNTPQGQGEIQEDKWVMDMYRNMYSRALRCLTPMLAPGFGWGGPHEVELMGEIAERLRYPTGGMSRA